MKFISNFAIVISIVILIIITFLLLSTDNNEVNNVGTGFLENNNNNHNNNNDSTLFDDNSDVLRLTYVSTDAPALSSERISAINSYLRDSSLGVQLDFVFLDDNNYYEALTEYINNGNKTDIIYSGLHVPYWKLIENGYLEALDSFFSTETGAALYNSIPERKWDSVRMEGLHYGISGYALSGAFKPRYIINKELADKYGFNENYFNKPIYELYDTLIHITAAETGSNFSTVLCYPVSTFPSCFKINNDVSINFETGLAGFYIEDPEYQRWLETYYNLAKQGGLSFNVTDNFFMEIVSSSMPSEVKHRYSPDDFYIVDVDCYNNFTSKMGLATCISSSSTEKDTALAVITEIFTKRELTDIFISGLYNGIFVDSSDFYLQDGKLSEETSFMSRAIIYATYYGNFFISTPLYDEYIDKKEIYFDYFENNILSSPYIDLPISSDMIESPSITTSRIAVNMLNSSSFAEFVNGLKNELIDKGVGVTVEKVNNIIESIP